MTIAETQSGNPCAAIKTLFAILLLSLLASCGPSTTLVDENTTVSSGGYWSATLNLTSTAPVSVNLTSTPSVTCLLMNESQFTQFQSLAQRGGGSFMYMQDFSAHNTMNFKKTARLNAGKWTFVVLTTDYSRPSLTFGNQNSKFHMIIKGGWGTSATTGGGGAPAPASPTPAPTPQYTPPTPFVRNTPAPAPPPPPPEPLKLTFDSLPSAFDMLSRGRPPERDAALGYVARQPVTDEMRSAVISAVMPLAREQTFQHRAVEVILKWASKYEVQPVRELVQSRLGDVARLDPVTAADTLALVKLLYSLGDADATASALRLLESPSAGTGARETLKSWGAASEPAIIEVLKRPAPSATTLRDLLPLLAETGTEKSIELLQELAGNSDANAARQASDALTKLAERLKLSTDQYLFNLYNRYQVDAPTGFTADTAATLPPNTRRWSRQLSGRAVRSTYTVQVRRVGPDFKLNTSPQNLVIQGASLAFFGMNPVPAPQFTQSQHVAALDGEYLIEITVIADTTDGTGTNNMSAAAKKIKRK
jgi:hypothetical protein